MTVFWSLAALMVLLGLALFWPVLLGRTQRSTTRRADLNVLIHKQRRRELAAEAVEAEQAAAIEAELDRALLNDLDTAPTGVLQKPPAAGRAALIGALLSVTLIGVALYGQLGRLDLLQAPPTSGAATRDALQATIEQLAAKLAKNPNDLEGWVLLGRSLQATEAPKKALTAFEFARKLAPDNLDVTALYAQALAEAEGGSMAGQPTELVDGVLARDPNHPTALWLAGLAAAERRDAQAAIAHWQRLATQLPADSEEHRTLAEYIARAEAMAPAAGGPPPPVAGPSTARTRITVRVSLAPTLKDRAAPEDSVFVFARAADGPPMPLAVVRRQVKDLPLDVTLDDSMAMMESRKLSSFERIVIGARVSKSGKPTPSPGDLQGLSAPVASATTTAQVIEIRDIVP